MAIRYACDAFEPAADFLGRNMPAGVKGATINAVGSSLPELFTSAMFLFEFADRDGFAAGIATCAGSAVFNVAVIPACCVLAVAAIGVKQPDGTRKRISHIKIDRRFLVRNGVFFLLGELVLISLLSEGNHHGPIAGVSLVAVYAVYLLSLWGVTRDYVAPEPEPETVDDSPRRERASNLSSLIEPFFDKVLFRGRPFTTAGAWGVISLSVAVLGVACHYLAQAVVDVADYLEVAPYFTALILAAAATSIPDTILSVKDSLKGEYDDAIANAVGSNTFDIGIGIGLPLLVYTLIYGHVEVSDPKGIIWLLYVLIFVTVVSLGIFLASKRVGRKRAFSMLAMYGAFVVWIIGTASGWWPGSP